MRLHTRTRTKKNKTCQKGSYFISKYVKNFTKQIEARCLCLSVAAQLCLVFDSTYIEKINTKVMVPFSFRGMRMMPGRSTAMKNSLGTFVKREL